MNIPKTANPHSYEYILERLCEACRYDPCRVRLYILAAGTISKILPFFFSLHEGGCTYLTVALPC